MTDAPHKAGADSSAEEYLARWRAATRAALAEAGAGGVEFVELAGVPDAAAPRALLEGLHILYLGPKARLTSLLSLFHYCSVRCPRYLSVRQVVLCVPSARLYPLPRTALYTDWARPETARHARCE